MYILHDQMLIECAHQTNTQFLRSRMEVLYNLALLNLQF